MKIMVLNNSGNVGKTLVARHLLVPRLDPACARFSVESINHGVEGEKVRGRNLRSVLSEIELHADAVVDVGSSNIEACYEEMRKMPGAHKIFDLFVVPTTPQRKQHFDTLATLDKLQSLGVPLSKLRVVLNAVDFTVPVDEAFPDLAPELRGRGLSLNAVIHQSDVFDLIEDGPLENWLGDIEAVKRQLAAATTIEQRRELATAIGVMRLATGVKQELDAVFVHVTGLPARDSGPVDLPAAAQAETVTMA